jgi:hypothetical protein
MDGERYEAEKREKRQSRTVRHVFVGLTFKAQRLRPAANVKE